MNNLQQSVRVVSEPWINSPYYDDAEQWTFVFWNDDTPFRQMFNRMKLDNVVELACGFGRHAERSAPLCRYLTLMDVLPNNLERCRQRLSARDNVSYIQCSGSDFRPVPDAAVTAIYCYDAMVHFSRDLVTSYLLDASRILVPGGTALFHHSNYPREHPVHYGRNPHARNAMTQAEFASLTAKADLTVVESRVIGWAEIEDLDCITLVAKPS